MDTLLRIDRTRILAAACCLALAAAAWASTPASMEFSFLRLALTPGLLLTGAGLLLGGRRGALVAIGLWCEIVVAMLIVGVLYLLLTGPILPGS
jgi:hypothetical protein